MLLGSLSLDVGNCLNFSICSAPKSFFLPTVATIKLKKKEKEKKRKRIYPQWSPAVICALTKHTDRKKKSWDRSIMYIHLAIIQVFFIIIIIVLVFLVDFSVANETPLVCQYCYKQISSWLRVWNISPPAYSPSYMWCLYIA